ncbi:putative porin [Pseudomonas sp. MWU16-30317]|uniref:putative porin n=1 Tax=Pseudomonas sp. MWU16-30317 TaxID=2878095 RepID=UPI001CFAC5BD|nr:putative porin [Pseudomonas sp. MWU16-30317]
MGFVSKRTAAGLCGGLILAASASANAAVDAKLLEMLKANGSITPAQYSELQGELAKDQQQAAADAAQKKTELSAFDQKVAWAAKTQIHGDVRVRQENIDQDHGSSSSDGDRIADRQRIRARLGVYSEINPQVDAGIRVATGGSNDTRSTNQDLNGNFSKKSLWLDLGYLDWHPTAVPNLHLIGGKMNQPWVSMGDVIWDSDINPEGVAATYKLPLSKDASLFGSLGYYTLTDNVDGEGYQYNHDLSLYAGQLGGKFNLGNAVGVTVGGSLYTYNNEDNNGTVAANTALSRNGNSVANEDFRLWEGFGQLDIKNLPIPLAIYGQYVKNSQAVDSDDKAYLVGVKTKLGDFSLDYNYRRVENNAVVGAFTDSDFGNGYTGAHGSKIKLGYDIDKNFGLGVTYFMAKTNTQSNGAANLQRDDDVNTLQLDLEAKF